MTRIRIVFWLDLTLLLSICALETLGFTGLVIHEWLATGLIALIFVHILLSWNWIAASSRRLLARKSARTRVNFVLNFCLFLSIVTVVLSGLMISEIVLPALGIKAAGGDGTSPEATWGQWRYVHNQTSDLVLILAGLHLAINWDWSLAAARRCLGIRPR